MFVTIVYFWIDGHLLQSISNCLRQISLQTMQYPKGHSIQTGTVIWAGPHIRAGSVKMVSPALISRVATRCLPRAPFSHTCNISKSVPSPPTTAAVLPCRACTPSCAPSTPPSGAPWSSSRPCGRRCTFGCTICRTPRSRPPASRIWCNVM